MNDIKKVLVLAPHPDDAEFGCGGTIKKLSDNGATINYAAFSSCNESLPSGFEDGVLFEELKKAASHLGIDASNIITFDYPVRKLQASRQEILEELVKLKKELDPELIILPSSKDIHQDHVTIHNEGLRAFKHARVLGYELPWNNIESISNFHVLLQKEHLDAKIDAINEYESQSFRKYKNPDLFYGLARVRGIQIGEEYAEGFELVKWSW